MYCFDDGKSNDIYLQATKDDSVVGLKHVYFVFRVGECTEETRVAGDPTCDSHSVMEDWMSDKYIHFVSIAKSANLVIQQDENGDEVYNRESFRFLNLL